MDRIEVEEIVTGLIITGKKTDINVEFLSPEALEMVEKFNKGSTVEELISSHGELALSAIHAAQSLNGSVNYNWNEILQLSVKKDELIQQLEWKVKNLRDGKDVDFADLDLEIVPDDAKLKRASDVIAIKIPLIKSGCEPIDKVIGGIPGAGLIVFLSHTATGKTTFIGEFADWFLSEHPDKTAIIFSTEMLEEEMKMRLEETGVKNFDRLYLYNYEEGKGVRGLKSLIENAGDDLGLVVVDMIDDLIVGTVDEPKMAEIYQVLAGISRKKRIPILATALPHTTQNKVLRPHNLRWTRMAEGRSYMVISLFNPMKCSVAGTSDDPILPRHPGIAWLCIWKVRGGIRTEEYKDTPQIAIPIKWRPDLGFYNKFLSRPSVFHLTNDKD